jgi:prepilin-type N-terminal cleavage/methylation domain-containing protein
MRKLVSKSNSKYGFTLIELVVSMAIFLVVITLAVGAFVSVSRMKALTSTMKEVQQKTRIATEMITRLSRQADKVVTDSDGGQSKWVELYFNLYNSNPNYGNRFSVEDTGDGFGELLMYECDTATTSCGAEDWVNEEVLLGDTVKLRYPESYFKKTGSVPPRLEVRVNGVIETAGSAYYSNEIVIDTDVILEGIK